MKILFLCTAFNSLSQRVALVLKSQGHAVTIELALSPESMTRAAELALPDIILCPFLTKRVPPEIYNKWLTLIVHPGPPGDAGPSALDWTLLGDLGESEDAETELAAIDQAHTGMNRKQSMRSHWGVTVLQAIEAFDAGPVWAFDQFELDQYAGRMSKSDLYRGPVTCAAVNAVLSAIEIIKILATDAKGQQYYSVKLQAPEFARSHCVSRGLPFQGGTTHDRPLLKASSRDFLQLCRSITGRVSAEIIVQRIRCGDSQPGVLTRLFGTPMFIYNATVQRDSLPVTLVERAQSGGLGTVLATRDGAVLVEVGADLPIWISHLRRPKAKTDKHLHPKLPATMALLSVPDHAGRLGLLTEVEEWSVLEGYNDTVTFPWRRRENTYQQVWVELEAYGNDDSYIGYVHSEFYNGAFSTSQCEILLQAINWTLAQPGLKAIVMLGGSGYFSNGIALNVIEGSPDPSAEGWANINAIDDCVQALLAPAGVLTFAAIRGNAAAGGLAMATAADIVLCAESVVLNPHYRGIGLFGSEWHTYSWYERCGVGIAAQFTRDMLPMSAREARRIGLIDHAINNEKLNADQLLSEIKLTVRSVMTAKATDVQHHMGAPWTRPLQPVYLQDHFSLPEHMLWNKTKFLAHTFSNKGYGDLSIDEHFQVYRKQELDQMTLDFFHPQRNKRFASRCTAFVRKLAPSSTPLRFALHRRHDGGNWVDQVSHEIYKDEEEMDEFDSLGHIPASAVVTRLPFGRPEYVRKPGSKKETDAEVDRPCQPEWTPSDSLASSVSSLYSETMTETTTSTPSTPLTSMSPFSGSQLSMAEEMDQALNAKDVVSTEAVVGTPSRVFSPIEVPDLKHSCTDTSCTLAKDVTVQDNSPHEAQVTLWSCYYSESGDETVDGSSQPAFGVSNVIQIR